MNYKNNPQDENVSKVLSKGYTFPFPVIFNIVLLIYAFYDLFLSGNRYLAIVFGIESDVWIMICVVAGIVATVTPVGMASLIYTRYTGKVYVEDRTGFVKAGGQDIGDWSGKLAYLIALVAFAQWIPVGWSGWFRPIALLLSVVMAGNILAFIAANLVFSRLFHRPRW